MRAAPSFGIQRDDPMRVVVVYVFNPPQPIKTGLETKFVGWGLVGPLKRVNGVVAERVDVVQVKVGRFVDVSPDPTPARLSSGVDGDLRPRFDRG